MEKIILMKKTKRVLSRIVVFFIIDFLIIIAVSLIGKSTLYTYADLEGDLEASYDYVEDSDDNRNQEDYYDGFQEGEENGDNQNEENIEENTEEYIDDGTPRIYSEAAILMEMHTGKILYEKDAYARKYPASTTKIMTAILAIENGDLDMKYTASQEAVALPGLSYTTAHIQAGETFTLDELLGVLMLQSANEAANVIAEGIAGSTEEFVDMMNDKANELGCKETHFVNANGIHDENHYSTAYDMATIAAYCMKNETFRRYANMMDCWLPDTEFWGDEQKEKMGERHFYNTNKLLIQGNPYYYKYCTGMKTGFTTPAKNCLVASSDNDGFELIAVVLHAEQTEEKMSARYMDTINLFEYGYNNFSRDDIYEEMNYTGEDKEEEQRIIVWPSIDMRKILSQTESFIEKNVPQTSVVKEKGFSIILVFGLLSVIIIVLIGVIVYIVVRKKLGNR